MRIVHHLIGRFARAGVDLRLANAPFTGNSDISQMDIRRSRPHDPRSEHFLAWMASDDIVVTVQGVDPRERQLVLFVREARVSFTEHCHVTGTSRSPRWARLRGALGVRPELVEIQRDEAHEALRPTAVPKGAGSVRQGEWFFVAPSAAETEVGKNKAEALKLQLASFWGVKAARFGVRVTEHDVATLCASADLVVDAFDNAKSRRLLSAWARTAGKPLGEHLPLVALVARTVQAFVTAGEQRDAMVSLSGWPLPPGNGRARSGGCRAGPTEEAERR